MTVSELIDVLNKIEDKTLSVKCSAYENDTSYKIDIKKVMHIDELYTQYTPQEYILIGE